MGAVKEAAHNPIGLYDYYKIGRASCRERV